MSSLPQYPRRAEDGRGPKGESQPAHSEDRAQLLLLLALVGVMALVGGLAFLLCSGAIPFTGGALPM